MKRGFRSGLIDGATVTWSGDNDDVATINAATGVITLVGVGTVTFTANYAGVTNEYQASSDTYEMTVTSSAPYVQPTSFNINFNDTFFGTSYGGTASGITDSNPVSGSLNNVTVTYAGSGDHYINSSQIRFYPSNKLTFEAPTGYIITQIVFIADGTWTATITANAGTYTSGTKTWTGEATSVLFTGSGSGQCRMSGASIKLTKQKELSSIAVSGTYPTEFEVGDAFSHEGTVVTATYDDDSEAVVTSSATFSTPDMSTAGTKTITVSYTENAVEKTTTYNITVNAGAALESITLSGTYPTTFNVGDEFSHEGMIVTANFDNSSSADVTSQATFTGYDMSAAGVQTITVSYTHKDLTAKTTTYSITVNTVAVTGVSVDATASVNVGETTTLMATISPDNATNKNVTWESSDEAVATVNASGVVTGVAVGTTTITVKSAEDASFSASCTVTVSAAPGTAAHPYTVAEVEGQATSTTFGNNIYVTGYIVGCVKDNKCYKTTADKLVDTNLLLADTPDVSFTEGVSVVSNEDGLIPVELPSSPTSIRANWGVVSNNVMGYKVILKGNAEAYFGTRAIKGTSEISAVSVPAKLNTSGYATFASTYPLDFSDDSEFSAWQITAISGTAITFSQITGTVAAGTGVFLKGTVSEAVNIPVATLGTDISGTNKLVGITSATEITAGQYYGLSGNQFVKVNAGTIPAGKALLPANLVSGARALSFVFEDESAGVSTAKMSQGGNREQVYDLQGRRVMQPQKGLYIVNGKKVLVK